MIRSRRAAGFSILVPPLLAIGLAIGGSGPVMAAAAPTSVLCPLFAPAEAGVNDRFGSAIGVDGDSLAIGAWLADEQQFQDAGSVTTFTVGVDGGVAQDQRIVASEPQSSAHFGFSVDLDGDILAVGAPDESVTVAGAPLSEAGALYIFERSGVGEVWGEVARLVADDAEAGDLFGYSIEVDAASESIVVGAQADDLESPGGVVVDAGSAYLFTRDPAGAWSQEAKLVDPAARAGDRAGHDVGLSGSWIVVGHHLDDQVGDRVVNNAGGSLLFERGDDGLISPLELTGSSPRARDRAGVGVDVDGDLLVMTGWAQGPQARSVLWIFRYDGQWREEARIEVDDFDNQPTSADDDDGTHFGRHVELVDGLIAVGASRDGLRGPEVGAVHYFGQQAGEWTRLARVAPDEAGENAQAGISVGLSLGWAAIGAERAEVGSPRSGGACVLSVEQLLAAPSSVDATGVEVFVDAGERPPAPAEPLAVQRSEGPIGRLLDLGLLYLFGTLAAIAVAAMAIGFVVVKVRARSSL